MRCWPGLATTSGRRSSAPSRSWPRCCNGKGSPMADLRKLAAAIVLALSFAAPAAAQTLKVAMGSDIKILDPIWTSAYAQRDFGYMVWDVLFALDEKLEVRPQMVERWEVSPDQLAWTFTLRDNKWSNGQPVTAEDCIASIK